MEAVVGKERVKLLSRFLLIWILLGNILVVFFGCSRHPVLTHEVGPGRKVYSSASPADLSEYIRTVLKISQEDTQSREALKKLHERRPELEELVERIAANPEDIESRRTLAADYFKEGLYYSAFELYQQMRSTELGDAAVEQGLARIWDEWGKDSLAKRHAERALELDPQSAEALELLGTIHLHRNDPQAAGSAFLAALALAPEDPSLPSAIGMAYLELGNWTKAHDYLEKALALDPALIETRNNLAYALARLGDYDGALYEFAAANPPTVAFNKLGVVYLAERKWAKAQNAFKQALVQDPNYLKARLNLSIAQSYFPPPTIVHLPPLEAVQDTPMTLRADAERVLDPRPVLSGASAHLPTTAIMFLAPFEEWSPTPDLPDLVSNTRDQEEKQVSELKLTFQDPFTGPKLSSTLNTIQLQTLSQSDPIDGELLQDNIFLVGPLAERKLVPAFPPDDDGALGNVVPEEVVWLGKGVNSVPRIVLETSSQISALERNAYLNPVVFLLNPTLARGDGQVHQNSLSPLVGFSSVTGRFDIRDFIAPFRDPARQHQHQWKSSLPLGPKGSAETPLKGGLSGIGLGVVLCFLLGGPLGAVVWKQTSRMGGNPSWRLFPFTEGVAFALRFLRLHRSPVSDIAMALQPFADRVTEDFFFTDRLSRKAGWSAVRNVARRKLDMLHHAVSLDDLRVPPGNCVEALDGDLRGFFSIRLSDQWRILFRWTAAGPSDVRVTDYQ